MQEQRSKLDERMMAAVVSSIKAAEVIIAVVDSSELAAHTGPTHSLNHCLDGTLGTLAV